MIPLNDKLYALQRSPIRQFTNLANQTPGCIKLTIGEPDFDTPQAIKEAAIVALKDGQTHYAPNQGLPALRQAIAKYETDRGMTCTAEQVLITAGATGALFTALLGILNPGDEVILPTPAFNLYETIITVAGAVPVRLDTTASGFQITPDALAACITPKTKAIVLNSPNNPTGVVLDGCSLDAVKQAILGRDIFLICDNVYDKLTAGHRPDLSLDHDLRSQVLLCQSFSKPYAMTGWRIGYLIGPEDVMERLLLLNAAEIAAVPTFLQAACITALETETESMAATYARRREYACRQLTKMGLTYPQPQGAFYVFPNIAKFGLSSQEFCTRMIQQAGVAAVPGSCFGAEGYIRLSFACSDEDLEEGLNRLAAFIRSL